MFDVTTKFIELKIMKRTELSLENSRRWNASCQLCPSMDIIMSHVLGGFEIAISRKRVQPDPPRSKGGGVSFLRNCVAASVGDYNKVI